MRKWAARDIGNEAGMLAKLSAKHLLCKLGWYVTAADENESRTMSYMYKYEIDSVQQTNTDSVC